ncbi:MAG: hypothetical protein [Inoviridae sp.]|nr:MAG: hypothetical protein [Inoviridae sp.]
MLSGAMMPLPNCSMLPSVVVGLLSAVCSSPLAAMCSRRISLIHISRLIAFFSLQTSRSCSISVEDFIQLLTPLQQVFQYLCMCTVLFGLQQF